MIHFLLSDLKLPFILLRRIISHQDHPWTFIKIEILFGYTDVFQDSFLLWKPHHTGCIYMASLQCAFTGVLLDFVLIYTACNISCTDMVFPKCELSDVFWNCFIVKVLSHWLQVYGFLPLWVFWCISRLIFTVKASSHWLHLYGFFPVWVIWFNEKTQ